MMSPDSLQQFSPVVEIAKGVGLYLGILLPVVLVPWYTLAYRASVVRLIFFSLVMFATLDALLYWIAPFLFPTPDIFSVCFFIQFGAGLSVLITTLPLRFCGYRMMRVQKTSA
jgi:hypothetical protein